MARAPDPGPYPARQPGQSDAERQQELDEFAWAALAHAAVHGADPSARERMLRAVSALLLEGKPLPAPAREWLLLCLHTLHRTGALPTTHRGRPADSARERDRALRAAKRFAELRHADPRARLVDLIAQVAEELSTSESTISKLYKSREFKELIALHARSRKPPSP